MLWSQLWNCAVDLGEEFLKLRKLDETIRVANDPRTGNYLKCFFDRFVSTKEVRNSILKEQEEYKKEFKTFMGRK